MAKTYFQKLGISRVTETTRLDRIGMPVAMAIRPSAGKGSLIVTAGKGAESIEALTGAAMESIELAYSEAKNSFVQQEFKSAYHILDTQEDAKDILRLCPIVNNEIDLNQPMSMVELPDLLSKNKKNIPGELLFIPFIPRENEKKHFGYHTNGLASGNCYEEAIIHALFEVIERDILSFEFIQQQSFTVDPTTVSEKSQCLINQIEREALEVIVKTVKNEHQIPFFKAYIIDKWAMNPTNINAGYGCHGSAEIALTRALSEAAQSRMSYIHGGREDLTKGYEAFPDQNLVQQFQEMYASVKTSKGTISFSEIKSVPVTVQTIQAYLTGILDHIKNIDVIKEIYVARHTPVHEKLQVVKVVIPGMEFYNQETNRIGPRLYQFIQKLTQ